MSKVIPFQKKEVNHKDNITDVQIQASAKDDGGNVTTGNASGVAGLIVTEKTNKNFDMHIFTNNTYQTSRLMSAAIATCVASLLRAGQPAEEIVKMVSVAMTSGTANALMLYSQRGDEHE